MLGSNSFRNIYITFFVFILGCEFLFFSCRSFWFTASHYVGSEATHGEENRSYGGNELIVSDSST